MSTDKPIKLTCIGTTKRNAYIMPEINYYDLRNTIVVYLFGSGEAIRIDFRVYWIDQDNDEIDIVNQNDYDIFLRACKNPLHLYAVDKKKDDSNEKHENVARPLIDGLFPTTAVHTHVECNNCMLKPLVGFRYKCIECHDYDLCQICEAKHVHENHMMVRMPHGDCPNLIEAWVTGRSKRNHKRGGRCPVVFGPSEIPSTAAPGGGDSERHHRRSHRRRELNNGVFGHLYKMMVDLAEGGAQVNEEEAAKFAAESATNAANEAGNAAKAAAATAASAASTAARVAAEACANNASKASSSTEENEKKREQFANNTGAKPKSPQTTSNAGTASNSEPNSVPVSPSLENLAQFIDPQYMRTGIEILNNFSEMFAKMLDPEDGVGMSCPFDSAANKGESKNSGTSSASSNSKATSTNVEQTSVESQATVEKEAPNEIPTSTVESPMPTASPDGHRSQSFEESDWQMIDQQTTTTSDMGSAGTSKANPIDFAQLSKDLKAHIEDEKKSQEESQQQAAAATQTPNDPSYSNLLNDPAIDLPYEPLVPSIPAAQPTGQPKAREENRGVLYYHPDPRINNAVHAMIAMGFSNEGAWLTQLLESVNGSIPDALDLMNAAQRNNN